MTTPQVLSPSQVAAAVRYNRRFGDLSCLVEAEGPEAVALAAAAFQAEQGLVVDGMCGPQTLRALFEHRFGSAPPAPPIPIPRGHKGIVAQFGDPDFSQLPKGRLRVNSREFELGVGRFRIRGDDRIIVGSMRHELVPHFEATMRWIQERLGFVPHRVDSWVPRLKRNSDPTPDPSIHSYALAIDIDPMTNTRGDPTPSIPQLVFLAMYVAGFQPGQFWTDTDPMHFQWATGC